MVPTSEVLLEPWETAAQTARGWGPRTGPGRSPRDLPSGQEVLPRDSVTERAWASPPRARNHSRRQHGTSCESPTSNAFSTAARIDHWCLQRCLRPSSPTQHQTPRVRGAGPPAHVSQPGSGAKRRPRGPGRLPEHRRSPGPSAPVREAAPPQRCPGAGTSPAEPRRRPRRAGAGVLPWAASRRGRGAVLPAQSRFCFPTAPSPEAQAGSHHPQAAGTVALPSASRILGCPARLGASFPAFPCRQHLSSRSDRGSEAGRGVGAQELPAAPQNRSQAGGLQPFGRRGAVRILPGTHRGSGQRPAPPRRGLRSDANAAGRRGCSLRGRARRPRGT